MFSEKEERAFEALKIALTENPVLLYNVNAETELHTDACMYEFGAILLQRDNEDSSWHPIYYASSRTTSAEERYMSYELEVFAVVKALKKFRVYLLGISFRIVTDAFVKTMSKKDISARIRRYSCRISTIR